MAIQKPAKNQLQPKDPVTKEQLTDAIYSIPCNDCDNSTENEENSSFVERWNRTIKQRMWKQFKVRGNTK